MLCRLGGVGLGRLILSRVLLVSVSGGKGKGSENRRGRRTVFQNRKPNF